MHGPDYVNDDILSLGMRADEARRSLPSSSRVLYQRVHVVASAATVQSGLSIPAPASEVRLTDTPAGLEDALHLVRALKEAASDRVVCAFSLAVLHERARGGWGDIARVLKQLAAAGLADVAELPADATDDLNGEISRARSAGLYARRVTIGHPLGDGKLDVLDRIRRAAEDLGGIVRVAPLPRHVPTDRPTTGFEDVRLVALARLTLNDLAQAAPLYIEVDWTLYGPKLAQVALTFGADFLDAVPATTDESLGPRRSTVAEVERNIRAAGFEPEEYRPS